MFKRIDWNAFREGAEAVRDRGGQLPLPLRVTCPIQQQLSKPWWCCCCCCLQLGCAEGLPDAVSEELLQDDGFLQKFHHALLEVRQRCRCVHVHCLQQPAHALQCLADSSRPCFCCFAASQVVLEEGALVCPETGRRFPVAKGIPNLLLNEDEV